MRKYITPEMFNRAEEQLNKWIPEKNNNPTSVTVKTTHGNKQPINNLGLSQTQKEQLNKIVRKWKS